MFKKEDLKVGYVIELEKTSGTYMCMILENKFGELCASSPDIWFPVDTINEDMFADGRKITKVYGLTNNRCAHQLNEHEREKLWDRREYELRQAILEEQKIKSEMKDMIIRNNYYDDAIDDMFERFEIKRK